MRRVFKQRQFANQALRLGIPDAALCAAVDEMERGLVDAKLGSGLVKKRVSLPGRGKSGGARTLLASNLGDRWFFVYGFAKNERDNISPRELEALRSLAKDLLSLDDRQCDALVAAGAYEEICHAHPKAQRNS